MARVLLSLAILGSGCLVPQDSTQLPPDPRLRNHAPYFIRTTPTTPYIVTDNCEGTTLSFRVVVADPEVDDTVRVRYYVDFDPLDNQGFEKELVLTNTNDETRQGSAEYDVKVGAEGTLLRVARNHIVEAVAFDGTLSPTRNPEPLQVYPDAGVDESYMAITQWVVVTEECLSP